MGKDIMLHKENDGGGWRMEFDTVKSLERKIFLILHQSVQPEVSEDGLDRLSQTVYQWKLYSISGKLCPLYVRRTIAYVKDRILHTYSTIKVLHEQVKGKISMLRQDHADHSTNVCLTTYVQAR